MVVVSDTIGNDTTQDVEVLGVEEQRTVLDLEATEEALHLGVVACAS